MHARGFFAPFKQKDRQNEFGVTFGGPVLIPKLYDGRNRTGHGVSPTSWLIVGGGVATC